MIRVINTKRKEGRLNLKFVLNFDIIWQTFLGGKEDNAFVIHFVIADLFENESTAYVELQLLNYFPLGALRNM